MIRTTAASVLAAFLVALAVAAQQPIDPAGPRPGTVGAYR